MSHETRAILPTAIIRTEWPPNDGVMPGDPQMDALLESIRVEGIRVPLTLNLGLFVIDGNHRLSAARLLGITHVPVRFWTGVEFVS
jgi:ParB-like chromosome segregation protein Spo0J